MIVRESEAAGSARTAPVPVWLAGLPNALSGLRIVLSCLFPWLSTTGRIAVALVSGFCDWLDGAIARRFGVQSVVGGLLDAIGDKLFLCIALATLTFEEVIPVWQTLLVLFRDLTVLATVSVVVVKRSWSAFGHMPANRLGKAATAGQFALVLALLMIPAEAHYVLVPAVILSIIAGTTYLGRLAGGLRQGRA